MTNEDEGMLLILNDVEPDHEEEFNLWYDTEHLKERVQVPGFVAAVRYRAVSAPRQYCALYRTRDVGVFESAEYRARLAMQSDWSRRVLRTFVNPHRSVGRISSSVGSGTGGFLSLLRIPGDRDGGAGPSWREGAIDTLAEARWMIAVSIFESVPHLSGPVAEYRPTTSPILASEDVVLLLEASQPEVLSPESLSAIAGPALREATHLGVYSFVWELAQQDPPRNALDAMGASR